MGLPSNSIGESDSMSQPYPNSKLQYSIRSLLIVTIFVAIICSNYRAAGPIGFAAAVVCSGVVGLIFIAATHQRFGWYCLAIFAGAIVGATIGVQVEACSNEWIRYRDNTLRIRNDEVFSMFGWAATYGAVIGGGGSTFLAYLVVVAPPLRSNRKMGAGNRSPLDEQNGR
jgi:hypothetical protein